MSDQNPTKIIWANNRLSKYSDLEVDLPWRKNKEPYKIFLAEMLLIRTRTDMVARVFPDVIRQFPSIKRLSSSSEIDLSRAIEPLGLKKRVPYIISAAKYIQNKYGGNIPSSVNELKKIPGIGIYTAQAIATFAYGEKHVPADVNIFRFLSRFTGLEMTHLTKGSRELVKLLPLLSEDNFGLKAEVLLDFSRLICAPRKPTCDNCLLTKRCYFYNHLSSE